MTALSALRMRCAGYIWESHVIARLFVGITCLGAGLHSDSMIHALILLAVVLALLLALGTPGATVLRAARVLAFLVLPILILHLWLTPGRLLVGGISAEGLERGGWLSLHLILMYFSAMLFSRLITLQEWMALTSACGGRRLQPYLLLLMPLARQVRWRTRSLARQWHQRGTWRELALALSAVVDQCMSVSRRQADSLWLRWPASVGAPHPLFAMAASVQAWSATLLMLLMGAGILAASMGVR
ncbi:MAG TPA: hypothetical protein VNH42_03535 [Mariprofundaceae bacterium]|nr:hypothetical protein [Mariprofundaceae bacterium]